MHPGLDDFINKSIDIFDWMANVGERSTDTLKKQTQVEWL
jgi:hypothetical protein